MPKRKTIVELVSEVFLDRYYQAHSKNYAYTDNAPDIDAIAQATAVAIVRAVRTHSANCHNNPKQS